MKSNFYLIQIFFLTVQTKQSLQSTLEIVSRMSPAVHFDLKDRSFRKVDFSASGKFTDSVGSCTFFIFLPLLFPGFQNPLFILPANIA